MRLLPGSRAARLAAAAVVAASGTSGALIAQASNSVEASSFGAKCGSGDYWKVYAAASIGNGYNRYGYTQIQSSTSACSGAASHPGDPGFQTTADVYDTWGGVTFCAGAAYEQDPAYSDFKLSLSSYWGPCHVGNTDYFTNNYANYFYTGPAANSGFKTY